MRTADLPPEDLPPLTRSVAACLAAILEIETAEVPAPPADHPEPWTAWRVWLATRGLGLVPIARPKEFAWPGAWLALLSGDRAAVAYGSPPGGLAWTPLGGEFADVEAGYVVARHHLTSAPHERGADGTIEALAIAPAAEAPMELIDSAQAHAGRGLEGDRYFTHEGTFSNPYSDGHDLTLIEARSSTSSASRPPRRAATSSPAASTSTRSSAGTSASARPSASAAACASRARTSSASPTRASCATSSTAAGCARTCSPKARSRSGTV